MMQPSRATQLFCATSERYRSAAGTRMLSVAGACLIAALHIGCGNVEHVAIDASPTNDAGSVADASIGQSFVLSQALSTDVTDGLGCEMNQMYTHENSFYRAFKLSDFRVQPPLHIKHLAFGVYLAKAGMAKGSQSVSLRIYAYDGPLAEHLVAANMSPLAVDHAMVNVRDTTSPVMVEQDVDAMIPTGSQSVVAEIYVADGVNEQNRFLIGANTQGDRAPAYHRAGCNNLTTPTSFAIHPVFKPYSLALALSGDTGA